MAKPKIEVALASVPIFEALSKRQLKKVASVAEVVNYMGGHSIVKEGDEGESIFIVLAGQAKVTVKGRTVGRTLPGDHFGEISLLDGGPRTASVCERDPHDDARDRPEGLPEGPERRSHGHHRADGEPRAHDPAGGPVARPLKPGSLGP